MPSYRIQTLSFLGTVGTTITQLASMRPLRLWASIECDKTVGVPLVVVATDKADSSHYIVHELQPGEKLVFSQTGDMPWTGEIYIQGKGGTAGYRGGECFKEAYS